MTAEEPTTTPTPDKTKSTTESRKPRRSRRKPDGMSDAEWRERTESFGFHPDILRVAAPKPRRVTKPE